MGHDLHAVGRELVVTMFPFLDQLTQRVRRVGMTLDTNDVRTPERVGLSGDLSEASATVLVVGCLVHLEVKCRVGRRPFVKCVGFKVVHRFGLRRQAVLDGCVQTTRHQAQIRDELIERMVDDVLLANDQLALEAEMLAQAIGLLAVQ